MHLRLIALVCLAGGLATAQSEHAQRLELAGRVFSEVMEIADRSIPQDLLDRAFCAVIVPGLKRGAFIFGAKYGRGFISCRKAGKVGWSAPGAVRIEGGSFGLQAGGSETDVIMLVMNERGAERLLSSRFTIGGDASVAAGPVGRTASAETDAYMSAEILTWSRSRGVFAGISLRGATLRRDASAVRALYGKDYENRDIVMKDVAPPAAAGPLIALLNKYSSRR